MVSLGKSNKNQLAYIYSPINTRSYELIHEKSVYLSLDPLHMRRESV